MSKAVWLNLLLGLAMTPAATGTPAHTEQEAQNRRERVYFSALDKEEKPVLGLSAADFELRIDGRRVAMEGFEGGRPPGDRSLPLVVWILLDANPNIQESVIRRQAEAAAGLFSMLHPDSAAGVKLVSDRVETLAPLAHDPAALRAAFTAFGDRRALLQVGGEGTVVVGPGGLAGALQPAMEEIAGYVDGNPGLHGREVRRALMIISDGNLNPGFSLKRFYSLAARDGLFLYPVLFPRFPYGLWAKDYLDVAGKTAGVGAVFGALQPGSEILPLPRSETGANALTANFIHMIRDLNGKYSFTVASPPAGRTIRIGLKCRVKGVRIRLPRKSVSSGEARVRPYGGVNPRR